MSEKYRGREQDRRYKGETVDITYSLKRCIHAEKCIHHLSEVFDSKKRPWINANGSHADEVARVLPLCPSGALHYERKDGGIAEDIPTLNRIIVHEDSYLQVIGDLEINGASVSIEHETRATLCRCGASKNKPFCDNTHKHIDFHTISSLAQEIDIPIETGGKLSITPQANGSIAIRGNVQIEDEAGQLLFAGTETWLCRCGGSANKPFCDGTHRRNGFLAD